MLDLPDPYAGRTGDDDVRVEVPGHQEPPYGDVLLGQVASKAGDESLLALVPVPSRRQGGPGAVYRHRAFGDLGSPPAGEVRGIGKGVRDMAKGPNAVEGENRRDHERLKDEDGGDDF